jgi:lysophospholipase L1-like esterase
MSTEVLDDSSFASNGEPRPSFWMLLSIPVLGILASLLIVEILVRIFLWTQHSAGRWSDRPRRYFFAEASRSVRDYYYPVQKPSGTFRIATIGDSFTFGDLIALDDTYSKRLERMLNLNEGAPRVEVLNFGVSGYSSYQERQVLKTALQYSPDLVVLQITLNDPELHSFIPRREVIQKDGLVHAHGIWDHWKNLDLIFTRLENTHLRNEYHEYFLKLFSAPRTIKNFEKGLAKIKLFSSRGNIPVVAVLFPLFSEPLDNTYPFTSLHQKVAEEAAKFNIPLLDLFDTYRGIPPIRLEVLPGENAHPNEIANRMAAEEIYRWLSEQRLLPLSNIAHCSATERVGLVPPILGKPEHKPAYCNESAVH